MDNESSKPESQIINLSPPQRDIYKGAGGDTTDLIGQLCKGSSKVAKGTTTNSPVSGRRYHPIDYAVAKRMKRFSPHHNTCLLTKVASAVGLGFERPSDRATREKKQGFQDPTQTVVHDATGTVKDPNEMSRVAEKLDSLCDISFQDVLSSAILDFYELNVGYVEVVREEGSPSGKIVGIHYQNAEHIYVVSEEDGINYHYEMDPDGDSKGTIKFARFGDLEDFLTRSPSKSSSQKRFAELIRFRRSQSDNRWYGVPDWVSGAPLVELKTMVVQSQFDFFNNRGVPEMMLFLLGATVEDKPWKDLQAKMKATIGGGNQHKSFAMNIADPNIKVQVEKLAMEGTTDNLFAAMADPLALEIVSAHRVPPLLAGIQIPGKLGATNELPNALQAFQKLVIGPDQHNISTTLSNTLGNRTFNASLGLRPADFVLRTILDEIDLGSMDTVARMREPFAKAAADGRNPADGLKQ